MVDTGKPMKCFQSYRHALFLAIGCLLLGTSCAEEHGVNSHPKQKNPITLQESDFQQLQAWLADNRGKVIVLDYWATWCPPCVKEFPELIALHHQTESTRLVCASFCCDFQGLQEFTEVKTKVLNFLKKHQADCTNFISTSESDELFQQMGIPSIPVVEVYSADGQLAKRFDMAAGVEFSYEEVRQAVRQLLLN